MIEDINKFKEKMSRADALLITAGAGFGVDSGLPDFRGNQGFWNAYPPIAKLGISFVEMANPHWFNNDPELAWAFYGHRLNLYRRTIPHQGFKILLDYAKSLRDGYFVFTSNVDGQFQKAGFEEDKIIECHGSIHHYQCIQPCTSTIWPASKSEILVDENIFKAIKPLPSCMHCNRIARPNILMFGDWSWISDRTENQERLFNTWLNDIFLKEANLVIIEVGAGKSVATVRMQSERVATYNGANLIRINPRDYDVPTGHFYVPTGAKEGIELLLT